MRAPREALLESFAVVRAQSGDDSAFERLYARYNDRLLYYLRRMVGASGVAEDTAQSVWLTVYRKIGTLEEPGAFRTWLYRIAHNQAVSALRKRGREVSWDAGGADVGGPPDDHAADTDEFDDADAAAVHAGLDRLSEPHREVLTLRFLHEMSYDEISRITDTALGTIRSRIHHAKKSLRRELQASETTLLKGGRR